MDSVEKFARRMSRLERTVKGMARAPQLANSSIENGAVEVYDADGQIVASVGIQFDGTAGAVPLTGPEPPVPSTPTLEPILDGLTVKWDGYFVDENGDIDITITAPTDHSRIEVHVSTEPGFVPVYADTLRGTIETPRGADVVVSPLPALPEGDVYYVRLVARTLSGKASGASAQATGIPAKALADIDQAISDVDAKADQALEQASASGDTTIFVSVGTPDPARVRDQDVWFQQSGTGGPVTAWKVWNATAGAWESRTFAEAFLPLVNIGTGTYGDLHGGRIEANTIKVESLLVGSLDNLQANPGFRDDPAAPGTPVGWAGHFGGPGTGWDDTLTYGGGQYSLRLQQWPAGSSNMSLYAPQANYIPVNPGDSFRITTMLYPTGAAPIHTTSGISQQVYFYDANKIQLTTGTNGADGNFPFGERWNTSVAGAKQVELNKWNAIGGTGTVPAGAAYMRPRLTVYMQAAGTPTTAKFYIGQVKVLRAADGNLVVDGVVDGRLIRSTSTTSGTAGSRAVTVTMGPGAVSGKGTSGIPGVGWSSTKALKPGIGSVGLGDLLLMSGAASINSGTSLSLEEDGIYITGPIYSGDLDARYGVRVSGVVSVPGGLASNATPWTQAVTFPAGTFVSPPRVLLTAGHVRATATATNVTANGFQLNIANWTSSAFPAGSANCSWEAIGDA